VPFAYYFDPAAFRDPSATIRRLEAARVLPADRAEEVDVRALEPIDRLIVVRELTSGLDTERLLARLGAREDELAGERSVAGIKIREYPRRARAAESLAGAP
jgi:hypothetical protein